MRRRVVNFASLLSLLLCLLTLALWVRSYSRFYYASRFYHVSRQVTIATEPARIVLGRTFYPPETYLERYSPEWDLRSDELPYYNQVHWRWRTLGFGTNHIADNFPGAAYTDEILVPFWFVAVVFAIVPILRLTHRLKAHRLSRRNHCTACSYDLSGNTSGACPECGSPVPATAKTPGSRT